MLIRIFETTHWVTVILELCFFLNWLTKYYEISNSNAHFCTITEILYTDLLKEDVWDIFSVQLGQHHYSAYITCPWRAQFLTPFSVFSKCNQFQSISIMALHRFYDLKILLNLLNFVYECCKLLILQHFRKDMDSCFGKDGNKIPSMSIGVSNLQSTMLKYSTKMISLIVIFIKDKVALDSQLS